MRLKEFQEDVLERLELYLRILKSNYDEERKKVAAIKNAGLKEEVKNYCKETWSKLNEEGKLPSFRNRQGRREFFSYLEKKDGMGNIIPNLCLKVPTGGGKTLLGLNAIERINCDYFSQNTGFVLWVVPTDAIYRQTVKNFKDRNHSYRNVLERMSGGRVKILQKNDRFGVQDLQEYLCVMILMLQSTNRETKESLRVFQDSGRFIDFFPSPDDDEPNSRLLDRITNLDVYKAMYNLGGKKGFSVKHSLGNAIRIIRPIVLLDEGHRAYSDLARKTICGLNPRFILELSATPNMKSHFSNILVSISGARLKEEEMIKLPINVTTSERADWKKTLCQSYEKLQELEKDSQEYAKRKKKYIRPIMLIQVERTGRDQREKNKIHSEDVRDYLIQKLNIPKDAIKIKVSGKDELKDENLLSESSQVRYIITKQALQEGWDCPFAYVLTILSNTQSKKALTQLIGRILRQPYAKETVFESLNECYVFCYNRAVSEVVDGIKKGLQEEGMDDLVDHIRVKDEDDEKTTVGRRERFKGTKIFLPRVLQREGQSWRNFIYEEDLLKEIDFSTLSYGKKEHINLDNLDTLEVSQTKIDIADSHGQLPFPFSYISKEKQDVRIRMDLPYMVKRLTNLIYNPWESYRILKDVITALGSRGVSDETVYLNRSYLLESIENDLSEQIHSISEDLFKQKLSRGEICFKIFKDSVTLNWEMANEIDFFISPNDKVLRKRDDSDLQLSLFDKTYQKNYNDYEKHIAWYLDESEAVKWWHRMVAKNDYYLQGWQKRKVYPDFLACVNSNNLNGSKLSVIETKGDHLKGNDDTEYKKNLFETLEKYVNRSVDVGTIETASEDEEKMVFKILMEKDWKEEIKQIV